MTPEEIFQLNLRRNTGTRLNRSEVGRLSNLHRAATLAERERCAKVAEGMWHALHKDIAAAIREEPTT